MFFIPGQLIALLTFPGVIVHEAAHFLFCRWRGVAVFDVVFFQIKDLAPFSKNPIGYVQHEHVDNFNSAFLIAVGPFIINSLLCILICLPAFIPVSLYNLQDPLAYFLLWLGISIGMHAFPSRGDAMNLWESARVAAKKLHPLAILSFPLVGLMILANLASFFWGDAIYAVAIGIGLPKLVLDAVV